MENSVKIFEPQILPDQSIVRPIIDNMTFVFHDASIREIFNHFDLDDYFDDFLFNSVLIQMSRGYVDNVILEFLHIHFQVHRFYLQEALANDDFNVADVVDKKLAKVRIEFTGSALRYLRSTCEWNELQYLTKPFMHESDHLTRVDAAYDLVNYRPDFLKKCIDYTNNPDNLSPNGRLRIFGMTSGLCFETRGGAIKTLYLGSPQSDKRLRIYDKKYEQGKNLYQSDFPECSSWIRIEWQCRNKVANGFHVQDVSDSKEFYLRLFKNIYETFHFCYYDKKQRRQVPEPFWTDLWNWEEIESIILNANLVQ